MQDSRYCYRDGSFPVTGYKKYRSRRIGIIENGTFGPRAGKVMREILSGAEDIRISEGTVTISSAPTEENMAQTEAEVRELLG